MTPIGPHVVGRLQSHLRERVAGFEGPLNVERLAGGQSNPTFRLTTPGRSYVMRCKPGPAAQLMRSAHAIEREFRVQAALADTEVPVARMHYLCEDESVTGCAFYVMDFVVGRTFWQPSLPQQSPSERRAIYAEMNRVISALHRLDHTVLNLADYGKPGNYFARQIDRWSRQYRASETHRIEAMESLMQWLPARIPPEETPPTALVHGDFRIDNLIFHPTEARVLAVIDWELSTLGHPIADFAYHTLSWRIAPDRFRGLAGVDLAALGIPSEVEYWSVYLRRTGLRVSGSLHFYAAYNLFRLAAILQGIAKRAQAGIASDAQATEVTQSTVPLAEIAWEFAQRAQRENPVL